MRKHKIWGWLIAVVVAAAIWGLVPTIACADDAGALESTIESYNSNLEAAVDGNTVTVTGTVTEASSTLALNIDEGVTVLWKASITASDSFLGNLITLTGTGTLEVAEGGTVSTASGIAIYVNGSGATVTISGGTVSAENNTIYGFIIGADDVTVEVSGGTVHASGNNAINIMGANAAVTVNGGTVSATRNVITGGNNSSITVGGTGKVSTTTGYAINDGRSSTVTISGTGKVSSTTGYAINAAGSSTTVIISDTCEVSATVGMDINAS